MKIFNANITNEVTDFLSENLIDIFEYESANKFLQTFSGLINFFDTQKELEELKESVSKKGRKAKDLDRTEYGDFQTNSELTLRIVEHLISKNVNPEIIIEPTCGKGNFIIACLSRFENIRKIFAIEIYKPYIWETKFNILNFFITNFNQPKPEIIIYHSNIFDFNFKFIADSIKKDELLIIGNPPWVTNSELSVLNSNNLPVKSNFKKHSGFDAITGKGNFDIGEYISLMLLNSFKYCNGYFTFLIKNSVIKNLLFDQKERTYPVSSIQKYSIDSKKEFNVSVDAALFFCKLNTIPEYECKEFNLYNDKKLMKKFGWDGNKFVSDIDNYNDLKEFDGICPFEWRQGVKHDCTTIMELERNNGYFLNGNHKKLKLEEDLIYGILKSSDLQNSVIDSTRKYTIITQKKIGQDTSYIKADYPKLFLYLRENENYFEKRKSSIYKNKPSFSIFGIGNYSFKPYKVAISGFYKNNNFSLILPQCNKPIMLDDTCYFLGFDNLDFAVFTYILLNHYNTQKFLESICFSDAKRIFTKDILMRIALPKLAECIDKKYIKEKLRELKSNYKIKVSISEWDKYLEVIKEKKVREQIEMF